MFWKIVLICVVAFFGMDRAIACTGIAQKAENGDWVFARTMEFGADLISFDLLFVPRGIAYSSEISTNQTGSKWTTKYGHVGFNPFGMPILADGLNEKGLACGAFYFPGWAEYEQIPSQNNPKAISNLDFVSWVLGNFATVSEVQDALKETKVVGVQFAAWGFIPPLHYFLVDQTGEKAVVEYVGGQLKIYNPALGTITNSPDYEWHTVNARNYIGLRALNDPTIKISGHEFSQFGQGSGAIGLPGDFSPPSRFIRAAFLNTVVLKGKDGPEQVDRAFKILNQFDIPKGAIKGVNKGKEFYDTTQWTSAADLSNTQYFFHTANNREIRSVSIKNLDLDAKSIKSLTVNTPEVIKDLSASLKSK